MACIAMYCIDFKMNLKSLGFWLCGFKSRSGTMQTVSNFNKLLEKSTTERWFFCI